MKLKQYIENLNKLAVKYPDADVIYAIDSEGNGYDYVEFSPMPCKFTNGEVDVEGLLVKDVNAVCIN